MKIKLSHLLTLAFLALSLGLATARAEDSAKTALAEQLLSLLSVDKNYDATYQRMIKMQNDMLEQQGVTPEQKQQREMATQAALKVVKEFASWEAIKPGFIQIYSDIFTVEELQGMIDFYKSPVGQKWLEKQPLVQSAVMEKMSTLMSGLQPKIMAAVKEAQAAQMQEQAPAATPVPSASPAATGK